MKVLANIALILVFIFGISCQNQQTSRKKIVEDYISALNLSNYENVISLFQDSIRMTELDYNSIFSKEQYKKLFQWDSVFQPQYQILELEEEETSVVARISKSGKRTLFLNGEPVITKERFIFKEDKIFSVDIIEYIVFNDEHWDQKRSELLKWAELNHPDLMGFIHDQTKMGALNYLKLIGIFNEESRN